ncbi:hypothetical protein BFP97_19090 [Roseivirga sp. 4D4]|uniref:SAM-dependent methyltransferase n=1 Tax=Roseivirga sp. 4D4 TaxID=1889784 RepID=UPI0008537C39|nr:methyltransferase domain-containing protein [Roseivirga sp. 4D4]OEK03495.1 hypothetical protein BFP97_19090 [Roseivirga sp. 4D4]
MLNTPVNREIFGLTPVDLIDFKLKVAEVKSTDIVVDLGCGDAMSLIRANQQYGAKGIGLEILPEALALAYDKIKESELTNEILIIEEDMMDFDFSKGDVFILYLNRGVLGTLSMKLENELKPGARIVTHDFDLPGWQAKKAFSFQMRNGTSTEVFLYER